MCLLDFRASVPGPRDDTTSPDTWMEAPTVVNDQDYETK